FHVTGVQTCALPICIFYICPGIICLHINQFGITCCVAVHVERRRCDIRVFFNCLIHIHFFCGFPITHGKVFFIHVPVHSSGRNEIVRASCRERVLVF